MERAIGPETAMICPPIGRSTVAVALYAATRPSEGRRPCTPHA